MKRLILFVLTSAMLIGCAHDRNSAQPVPTTQVDIFRDEQKPSRPYKELGLLSEENDAGQQGHVEEYFIKRAKEMAGDAIIFYPAVRTGNELQGLTRWTPRFVYKARVVVYTDK